YRQVSEWLPRFVGAGEEAKANGEGVEGIMERLYEMVAAYLKENGIQEGHPVYDILKVDFTVCAMGLEDYLNKRKTN
ncbi:MAG TPA: MBL fold metallo-hydrolase, partial [Bacillales bacterium]|nr:MBL fold metallo-hydrolase [Bacillales bacterium]